FINASPEGFLMKRGFYGWITFELMPQHFIIVIIKKQVMNAGFSCNGFLAQRLQRGSSIKESEFICGGDMQDM
ncbi:hypothetical protein, partial [Klebsiella pneumoniae]